MSSEQPKKKTKRKSLGEMGASSHDGSDESDGSVRSNSESIRKRKVEANSMLEQGMVDFPIGPVSERLVCSLCNGYFRDAYSITECLHSFCKSCLMNSFYTGKGEKGASCPKCFIDLRPDPFKRALADRTLQVLVDKMFPDLERIDEAAEKAFYRKRGIKRKEKFRDEDSDASLDESDEVDSDVVEPVGDELELALDPDLGTIHKRRMPPLKRPLLKTSGRFKIVNLKRYLVSELRMELPITSVEIVCNGEVLGDEFTLAFVDRTVWIGPHKCIELKYRYVRELHRNNFDFLAAD